MRVAVVTGGATGIGRAICDELLTSHWRVVSVDRQPSSTSDSDEFLHVIGDVSDSATLERAADAARERGSLQGWVNNAAVAVGGSVGALEQDLYHDLMAVNLGGTVWGCDVAVRSALRTGDPLAIVNMSSTQAHLGFPGWAAYATAKGGVEALTRQIAAEFVGRGIRCNAIAPGVIDTEMNRRQLAQSADPVALARAWDELTPVGRWGTPGDVAALAEFLLGDRAGFLTGQVIVLDGGQTVTPPGTRG